MPLVYHMHVEQDAMNASHNTGLTDGVSLRHNMSIAWLVGGMPRFIALLVTIHAGIASPSNCSVFSRSDIL